MKFSIKSTEFVKFLQPIVEVSNAGVDGEYPDAGRISLTVKSDEISVEANNGNVAATNTVKPLQGMEYSCTTHGTVTVRANDLFGSLLTFSKEKKPMTFEATANKLTIVPDDKVRFVEMPSEAKAVEMPSAIADFTSEASIDRVQFLQAINKVLFSIGYEKFQPQYMHWKLEVANDSLVAFCGDGGRFPLYVIEGKGIVKTKKPATYFFFKDQNPAFIKVVNDSAADRIVIKEHRSAGDKDKKDKDQFVVEVGSISMTLIGHDPGVKYPDPNLMLNRQHKYRFVTSALDWEDEIDGVWQTYDEVMRGQKEVHTTTMTFDVKTMTLFLKSDKGRQKTKRSVKILDAKVPEGCDSVEFTCVTKILKDMVKYGEGNVQFEIFEPLKPMVVKYYAGEKVSDNLLTKINATADTNEQYVLMFAAFTK